MSLNRFVDTAAGGTKGTLGLAAVKKALAGGMSKNDLKRKAEKQGIKFGAAAKDFLNNPGGFGATVKKAAKDQVISEEEVKKIMKIAPTAAKAVNQIAKSGATLRTSASNYIVEQARANPSTPRNPNKPVLGTSKLGKTLGRMAGVPGYKPTSSARNLFIKGEKLDSKGRIVTGRPIQVVTSGGGDTTTPPGGGDTTTPPGLTEIDKYFGDLDLSSIFDQQTQDDAFLNAISGLGDSFITAMGGYQQNMGDLFSSAMGSYQQNISDQMALMNQFAAPQPTERFFGAGQNYYMDAIRAAQRNRQRRSGYLRGGMGIGGQSGVTTGAPTSGLNIGSALGILGGVTG